MTSAWSLPVRAVVFLGWFIKVFVVSSVQVSTMILTPGRQPSPGIVRVELDDLSESELTLLVAIITITPDALVIAVDRETRSMYVYGMFVAGDADAFRASLRQTQARLVRGVRLRPAASRPERGGA